MFRPFKRNALCRALFPENIFMFVLFTDIVGVCEANVGVALSCVFLSVWVSDDGSDFHGCHCDGALYIS